MDKQSDFILLSEPEFGCPTFSFPDAEKSYELSYLTDIAVEWLDKAIYGLEHLTLFCVHAYLESPLEHRYADLLHLSPRQHPDSPCPMAEVGCL